MDIYVILTFLVVGAIAGLLAGMIMRGGGFGLLWNMIIGVIGAIIGGFVFDLLNISIGDGLIESLVSATIGAIILLFIVGLIKK